MVCLVVVGLMLNIFILIVVFLRLVFVVVCDGVLFFSGWVGKVIEDGRLKNVVIVMMVFGVLILCIILLSMVVFMSLVSVVGICKFFY